METEQTYSKTIITLLSDVGSTGNNIAIVKSLLINAAPQSEIVDISHKMEIGNLLHTSYNLYSSFLHFPKATIHILLIGIFENNTSKLILAEKEGHYFIAPDNGLLSITFGNEIENTWLCAELHEI